jgi:hypothetical protein
MSGLRIAAAALAVATLIAGVAGPAGADSRDHRDRNVRHRHYAPPRQAWGYDQPSYVAAPPPLVYAPPQGPAMLNFGITLPIR